MTTNDAARLVDLPRTPFGRLRSRFDARIEAAREVGASPAELDDIYTAASAARNLDPELKRLRRMIQTRSVDIADEEEAS